MCNLYRMTQTVDEIRRLFGPFEAIATICRDDRNAPRQAKGWRRRRPSLPLRHPSGAELFDLEAGVVDRAAGIPDLQALGSLHPAQPIALVRRGIVLGHD